MRFGWKLTFYLSSLVKCNLKIKKKPCKRLTWPMGVLTKRAKYHKLQTIKPVKGWLEAARQEINETWPYKVCLIVYILGTGRQQGNERERNDCHFMPGFEVNKIEISPKWLQSEVFGIRGRRYLAIHPSPRCRHYITQALLYSVDTGLLGLRGSSSWWVVLSHCPACRILED